MNKWMPSRKEVVVVLVVIVLLGVVMKTTFGNRRETARLSHCQSNLKQMLFALRQYTRDYDETAPLAHNWMDALYPYAKNNAIYQCPSAQAYGYAMNRYVVGRNEYAIILAEAEPAFFDTDTTERNTVADGDSWMSPGRHKEGNNVVFYDGQVKWLKDKPAFNPIPTATPTPRSTPTPEKTAGKR